MSETVKRANRRINGVVLTRSRISLERLVQEKPIEPRDFEHLNNLAGVLDSAREAVQFVETQGQSGKLPEPSEADLWQETGRILRIIDLDEQDIGEQLANLSDNLRATASLAGRTLYRTIDFVRTYEADYLSESGSDGCIVHYDI